MQVRHVEPRGEVQASRMFVLLRAVLRHGLVLIIGGAGEFRLLQDELSGGYKLMHGTLHVCGVGQSSRVLVARVG